MPTAQRVLKVIITSFNVGGSPDFGADSPYSPFKVQILVGNSKDEFHFKSDVMDYAKNSIEDKSFNIAPHLAVG
jgi:hypothetical protein